MASLIYTSFLKDALIGNIDVDGDTFYGMLVTSSYTPDKDHDRRDDVTNEVVGSGYTAGGQAVTVSSVTVDTVNDRVDITIAATTWNPATITARRMIVYKHRGGAASADELVCAYDFGADIISTAGPFVVTPSSPIRLQN